MGTNVNSRDVAAQKRVSKLAKKKVGSDMALIFGFGGAVFFILFFVTAPFHIIPLAELTGLSLSTVAVLLSFGLSAVSALTYARFMKPRIRRAQDAEAEMMHSYQVNRTAEVHEPDTSMAFTKESTAMETGAQK